MKKHMMMISGMMLVAAVCHAQFRLGAHGAYSNAGDVENEDIGFGGQLGVQMGEVLSMELSGTKFEDKEDGAGGEITTIALTARLGAQVSYAATLYGGAGVNYNIIDISPSLPGIKIKDTIGFHGAGGIEVMLNDMFMVFAEYRYTLLEPEIEASFGGMKETEKFDYNFGLARIGFNLVF